MKLSFKNIFILTLLLTVIGSCKKKVTSHNKISTTTLTANKLTIENKIDSLLNIMTIEEKVGQMNQYNGFWDATGPAPKNGTPENKYDHLKQGLIGAMLNVKGAEQIKALQKIAVEDTRLGIPLLFGFDVIHGYKTLSPIPLAEASSWDLVAIQKAARVAATEASSAGINWTFAPMVDITRDSRWGRVMEGAGEDPFLASKIATARVKGFQGEDLKAPNTIAACAKHFAAYGFIEAGKEYNTVDIGTSTLHNIILPPFKAAVDADVKTFMNGFNELNGVPVTANSYLQRDVLKNKWDFQGFVVSDWASIKELINWGHAKDDKQAAKIAANAGSDMDMEGYVYVNELAKLVKNGEVKETIVNQAVRRILRVKFELGLFDDPYRYCDIKNEKNTLYHPKHQEAVLDIAKKSIVLLKNENKLLPLKKEGQKIALIGALASDKNSPLGSWRTSSDDHTAVSVLEGLQKYTGNSLTYQKGVDVSIGETNFVNEVTINYSDKSEFPSALNLAKKSDVVIMVLGEHGFQSGEGRSRTELGLPGLQQDLLEEVFKVNKNIVLVLNNGRPLAIEWAAKNIPSIVEAWQLGSQSGNAIAQVLYGDYNPSGKLTMSFPRNVGQVPIYYNYKNTGRPLNGEGNVFWSHYSDSKNTPLFPFGYGLSYTNFKYSNFKINGTTFKMNDTIKISVEITNTGEYDGKEVVQLYIRDLVGSITRPVKELKGFELIEIKKGETKTVHFLLNKELLGFYNNHGEFITEPGNFKVFIGGSTIDTMEKEIELIN
ncbi:beta-glucosidase BglX [Oceanihabitans sp. 2_MG-2023]|uniref:beta-glucosidase BglX n=1 Tax=Oceanihabitans sp. 2_MG-2023 TaxID=3062661 RepID=UPI0026E1953B|nr:beta-glucosidase BglX [Oceanihabitans sp. 2_MG-2023]MDO6597790.1 beta-glucosidase BglX [Oceanihabitans sp. 2_MG-2023]